MTSNIRSLSSPSHPISFEFGEEPTQAQVLLGAEGATLQKDFVLNVKLAKPHEYVPFFLPFLFSFLKSLYLCSDHVVKFKRTKKEIWQQWLHCTLKSNWEKMRRFTPNVFSSLIVQDPWLVQESIRFSFLFISIS